MSNRRYYDNHFDVLAQDIAELIEHRQRMGTRSAGWAARGRVRDARVRRQWRANFRDATSEFRDWDEVCPLDDASRALEDRLERRADDTKANGSSPEGLAPVLQSCPGLAMERDSGRAAHRRWIVRGLSRCPGIAEHLALLVECGCRGPGDRQWQSPERGRSEKAGRKGCRSSSA